MAISFQQQNNLDGKPAGIITIDNGDLEALRGVMEQFGFVNEEAMLRYALVAMLNAGDNRLYIKRDGNVLAVNIAEKLLKSERAAQITGSEEQK